MPKRASAAATVVTVVTVDAAGAVAERAYFKALSRGFAPGHELEDWVAAEREVAALLAATEPPAGNPAATRKAAVTGKPAATSKKRKPTR
jgi:hypothetical protein